MSSACVSENANMPADRPNVLFMMTDEQRFDTIAALGNPDIYTPNYDRLVRRGVAFTNAYTSTPVCVSARFTIRTGCEPPTMGKYMDQPWPDGNPAMPLPGQPADLMERCGPFLARRMAELGYRTFGIGKFHCRYYDDRELGYELALRSEENIRDRSTDAYASFIDREHPEYSFIEQLHGERTDMYFMPQTSALPAAITVEGWAADRAIEQIEIDDGRPFHGFVSFIGPHPPFAPPIPFNRMYDPDRMPNPIRGDIAIDHLDEQIPWQSYWVWVEDVNDPWARVLKARYYGEISYIDHCIGRILDAVEQRADADNTVICFYSDHGELLGDHHGWGKEDYFEAACHVPFLVSWPARLPQNTRRDDLMSLADLYGIATGAAGALETRDGIDVLGLIEGSAPPREHRVCFYGWPGTRRFKCMVRQGEWKYIYLANGGREQLFNLAEDPNELRQRLDDAPEVAARLRDIALSETSRPGGDLALENGRLKALPFEARPLGRVYQFDGRLGVTSFPAHPKDVYPA